MKNLKIFIILFLILGSVELRSNEKNDKLKNEILKNIRCLICQGQSIFDSESDFAQSIKFFVEEKLSEGNSEKEIYKYLRDKYGDWILYQPEINKKTYILWLLPIFLFLYGGTIIVRKIKYSK